MYISREEKNGITQELLEELFVYRDGSLFWKNDRANRKIKAMTIAGKNRQDGYVDIKYLGKMYLAHRLVFLMFNGYLSKYIDHKNNIRNDNNPDNLRECTKSENNQNSKICINNVSGVKGVHWNNNMKKFVARVTVHGKRKHLGSFINIEDAKTACINARKEHGEFANNG